MNGIENGLLRKLLTDCRQQLGLNGKHEWRQGRKNGVGDVQGPEVKLKGDELSHRLCQVDEIPFLC